MLKKLAIHSEFLFTVKGAAESSKNRRLFTGTLENSNGRLFFLFVKRAQRSKYE